MAGISDAYNTGYQRALGDQRESKRIADIAIKKYRIDSNLNEEVLNLYKKGLKVEAIILLKKRTGLFLKEAKEYVDDLVFQNSKNETVQS